MSDRETVSQLGVVNDYVQSVCCILYAIDPAIVVTEKPRTLGGPVGSPLRTGIKQQDCAAGVLCHTFVNTLIITCSCYESAYILSLCMIKILQVSSSTHVELVVVCQPASLF